jgi:hypothetical protein
MVRRGEKLNAYRVLVGKPEGNRPPERPGHRWKGNNEMCLKKYGVRVWTGFIWLRIRTSNKLL